ncbi:hypothetical protein J7F03_02015 [Streptomyces sp. ISL-43]|uniref:hypothetical protein n=1 Tax=Streptomyces sp. ISL-43 TaxID=2819183 RepID=UPI001BE8B579|nr:hypothetical protein [Streptomyces sp. ISL-43]MBT2445883.1 hypothetical protein [Streptomyces sp. ISL-43]
MAGNDEGAPSVSDEEWARFMEQAAAGTGGAPQEPSARARAVAARLREEEARGGFGQPPGRRTGPAWQETTRRGRAGRRLKAGLAIAFVVALALIAIRPELVIDKVTGKAGQDARAGQPLPAETVRPSAAPTAVDPDRPTPGEPFKGSPALQWADGDLGIEVPEATALGGLSKEQVADGLARAKQFLVAANLDPATLRGERPQAALDLIDPAQGELLERLEQALARPGKDHDPLQMFVRTDSAEARLVGNVVKVRGRLSFQPGDAPGQVDVLADYTFVYPLVQAKAGADEVSRSIVRRQMKFTLADPKKWRVEPGTIQLGAYLYDIGNSACFVYDGYLHPVFSSQAMTGPTPSGTPVDPYDRSKDLAEATEEGCGTVSRT